MSVTGNTNFSYLSPAERVVLEAELAELQGERYTLEARLEWTERRSVAIISQLHHLNAQEE